MAFCSIRAGPSVLTELLQHIRTDRCKTGDIFAYESIARLQHAPAPRRLFINLSAQEIQGRGILGFATQPRMPPSSIVFEILECGTTGDMSNMGKFLANLRKQGFAFALDDFGSGYIRSTICGSYISNRSKLTAPSCTISSIQESAEILAVLQDLGIDYAQGFHLGLPLSSLSFPV